MFNKKSDPLLSSIQKVMNENALRRQLEAKLNEDLGVTSKKAIPHEYHSDYDKALNTEIQHALSEQTKPQTIGVGITHEPPKTMLPLKQPPQAPMTGSGSGGSGAQPPEGRRGAVGGGVRTSPQTINAPNDDPFQGASSVNEVTKAVVAQFNASELLTKREAVSKMIGDLLIARASDFHILLDDVSITHLAFSKEYTAAVEAKQVAQQDAERSKYIVEKAIQEKRTIVIRAEGEALSAELIGNVTIK